MMSMRTAENIPLGQMIVTDGSFTDNTSLQGGPNRYMKYVFERPENGVEYPLVTHLTQEKQPMELSIPDQE